MTVKEIVREYLKANGFDGLSDGDGCGCGIGELFFNCGNFVDCKCKPAYLHTLEECKECCNVNKCACVGESLIFCERKMILEESVPVNDIRIANRSDAISLIDEWLNKFEVAEWTWEELQAVFETLKDNLEREII